MRLFDRLFGKKAETLAQADAPASKLGQALSSDLQDLKTNLVKFAQSGEVSEFLKTVHGFTEAIRVKRIPRPTQSWAEVAGEVLLSYREFAETLAQAVVSPEREKTPRQWQQEMAGVETWKADAAHILMRAISSDATLGTSPKIKDSLEKAAKSLDSFVSDNAIEALRILRGGSMDAVRPEKEDQKKALEAILRASRAPINRLH